MARGGRGGKRGGNRGRGAGAGAGKAFSGGSSAGNGLAQSGGIANKFAGTSGGGAFGNKSGGSAGTKSEGRMVLPNKTVATIRSPGGDNTTVKSAGLSGSRVGPNLANSQGNRGRTTAPVYPVARKGAQYGRGGSTQ